MVTHSQLLKYRKELNKKATKSELTLISRLRLVKLRVRQQVIIPPFIVDILIPRKMLIIEVDGSVHDDPKRQEYDASRTQYLTNLGFNLIRVKNADVRGKEIIETALSYPDVIGRKCKQVRNIIDTLVAHRERASRPKPPAPKKQKQPRFPREKCKHCGTRTFKFGNKLGHHLMSGHGHPCPKGAPFNA